MIHGFQEKIAPSLLPRGAALAFPSVWLRLGGQELIAFSVEGPFSLRGVVFSIAEYEPPATNS